MVTSSPTYQPVAFSRLPVDFDTDSFESYILSQIIFDLI